MEARVRALLSCMLVMGCSSHGSSGHSDLSMGNPPIDGAVVDLEGSDLAPGSDLGGDDLAMPTPTPTPTPAPNINFNGEVDAILQVGDAWYYGGDFTRAEVIPVPNFVALDPSSGAFTCDLSGLTSPNSSVSAILQVGTSIYLGGNFTIYQGQPVQNLAKIDATTCALDLSFLGASASNGFNDTVAALATDGTWLYVAGAFTAYRGVANSANRIARLNLSTGDLDPRFGPPGASSNGFNSTARSIAVVGSSLFVGGTFTLYQGTGSAVNLARVSLTDGTLDTSFSPPGANGLNGVVLSLATDLPPAPTPTPTPGPFLYVGGSFSTYAHGSPPSPAPYLIKLDMTGKLDPSFNTGSGFDNAVETVAFSQGSVYVGGIFTLYRGGSANAVAKLASTDGKLDTTFSPPGANGFNPGSVYSLSISGSSLYVGGLFTEYRGMANVVSELARLDAGDGSLTGDFVVAGDPGGSQPVFAIASSSNRIWVGGGFTSYGGKPANHIAKYDSNGLDTTFTGGASGGFDGQVRALATDGAALYAGGYFNQYRSTPVERIIKLSLGDGSIDPTFHPSSGPAAGFNGGVDELVVEGGALYAGGSFTQYTGAVVPSPAAHLAKLSTTDGAFDSTFSPPAANGFDGQVTALAFAPAPSPALFVGGNFSLSHNGGDKSANCIAKVDAATGILDTTFSPQSGANGFDATVEALTAAGNFLYVGGGFTAYQGVPASALALAKLRIDTGEIDTTFSPVGTGNNGLDNGAFTPGEAIALVVSGGSLYVGGYFQNYRGVDASAACLAKLDLVDGSIDLVFDPHGAGMNGFGVGCQVNSLAAGGSILAVGGDFSSYRGITRLNAARVDLSTGALQ
jgi:hypothetical protein